MNDWNQSRGYSREELFRQRKWRKRKCVWVKQWRYSDCNRPAIDSLCWLQISMWSYYFYARYYYLYISIRPTSAAEVEVVASDGESCSAPTLRWFYNCFMQFVSPAAAIDAATGIADEHGGDFVLRKRKLNALGKWLITGGTGHFRRRSRSSSRTSNSSSSNGSGSISSFLFPSSVLPRPPPFLSHQHLLARRSSVMITPTMIVSSHSTPSPLCCCCHSIDNWLLHQ